MKKNPLMLVAIMLLISTIGFAQSTTIENTNKVKLKIKVSEIPVIVVKTLNKEYTNFTPERVFKTKKNNKQAYFISLIKNETTTTVYIDTNGNILNKLND